MESKEKEKEARYFSENLGLIGQSEPLLQVIESIKQVAPTNIIVLIMGESGTGKEMIAKAIHLLSMRKDKPLLTVNCGAIPEGILESELFGHEKGSFTGAVDRKMGYFEAANGGTLFLDEIGEMPLATQVKLLRVLEEKEFMRVGGNRILKVDVRVLAATNKDLEKAVNRQEFRKDLFYRLNAVKISVPPLRERKADIRPLVIHFAEDVCRENNIRFQGFTEDAFRTMEDYTWPGNIRELRNVVERVIILGKGEQVDQSTIMDHVVQIVEPDRNLPVIAHKTSDQAEREIIYRALLDIRVAVEEIRSLLLGNRVKHVGRSHIDFPFQTEVSRTEDLSSEEQQFTIREMERIEIEKALNRYKGNKRRAAKALGIGERTLYRKLKEYHIE
ncbi:sigma-54-dependent Fis family transcriptional regulator [bacterium]|nr:sigma-54-dependent Fis family transcriptional regulator [bacterium]